MKKLEARLTLLFTALVAVLLLATLGVTYFIAFNQYRADVQAAFNNTFAQINDTLISHGSISDKWLAQQEEISVSVVYIEDNGSPILFNGVWQTETSRDILISKAKSEAEIHGVLFSQSGIGQAANFSVEGSGNDKYRVAARVIKDNGKYIGVLMLQDLSVIQTHGFILALQYLAIWLCAIMILCIICRVLVHIAVLPAAQAAKQQTEFVAAASHELRSPLAVISASLDAAQKSKTEAQSFLQTARAESSRMAVLVDDLLLLASGDAKAWQIELQDIQPDSLCIELYDKFYPLAKNCQRNLAVVLPQYSLPVVQADKARLLQLFAILLENAMDYTDKNTAIEIIVRQQSNKVIFDIADHGKGIPPSEKGIIFTRFYRADKSYTSKQHLGLGLSVAQQIAEAHGTRLTVTDTVGGGATFTIELTSV